METKNSCCAQNSSSGISRRQAVTRLLQVVAGSVGVAGISGCPGGSTWGRSKLEATHSSTEAIQVGSMNAVGNIEISAADIPENTALELNIDGTQAYLYHGSADGAAVWYAASRVCTHMKCSVDFNDEAQEYHCPCHRSKFAVDGTVLKRPAKRDLQSWQVIDNGDIVEIVVGEEQA